MPTISQIRTRTMRRVARFATLLLRSLANEDRLLLLSQLVADERCVSELERLADIRQPTLSQQLGVLRNEGLVATRRQGKYIYYSLNRPEVVPMLNMLYTLYRARKGRRRNTA